MALLPSEACLDLIDVVLVVGVGVVLVVSSSTSSKAVEHTGYLELQVTLLPSKGSLDLLDVLGHSLPHPPRLVSPHTQQERAPCSQDTPEGSTRSITKPQHLGLIFQQRIYC